MTDEDEIQDERTMGDFLLDISERDDVPDDVREEAAEWANKSGDHADPDDDAEEGQEPG
jgi:hypothetical protein